MTVNRIQWKRGTAAQWTANNQVLASAEVGYETDTGKAKIGDGALAWNALAYATFGISGSGVSDGDKGDIVVTGGGTVWTFDSAVVTAFARTLLDDPDAATARATLGITTPPSGAVTVTITGFAAGAIEWSETVAAVGLVAGSRVFVQLAPPNNALENDPEMLDIAAMAAACLANDTLTVTMAFTTPTRGPIPLLYGVM